MLTKASSKPKTSFSVRKWEISDKDGDLVELEVEVEASSDQESQSEAMNFFLIFCILKDECGDLPEWQERLDFLSSPLKSEKFCENIFLCKKIKKSQKQLRWMK